MSNHDAITHDQPIPGDQLDAPYQDWRSKPAFLIGVTGYMDLSDADERRVRQRAKEIFALLQGRGDRAAVLGSLATGMAPSGDSQLAKFYRRRLNQLAPLRQTPIVLLTALAPGVDTIFAEIALDQGVEVRAALPFPPELYVNASTFVRRGAVPEENSQRQERFRGLLSQIGPDNTFHVPLKVDLRLRIDARQRKCEEELSADSDGVPARYKRYYAAGEYLVSYCHLLIAVWDGTKENSQCGTSAVVEARLHGPRPDLLPTTRHLSMAHGGPVLHIRVQKPLKAHTAAATLNSAANFDAEQAFPEIRWLHPFVALEKDISQAALDVGEVIAPKQYQSEALQRRRLGLLFKIAHSLEIFNSKEVRSYERRSRHKEFIDDRLTKGLPAEDREHLPLGTKFFDRLRVVSDFRCTAADLSQSYSRRNDRTLNAMFMLTLLAAIALHVFAHWNAHHEVHRGPVGAATHHSFQTGEQPADDAGHSADVAGEGNIGDEPLTVDAARDSFWWTRAIAGLAACLFVALALLLFLLTSVRGLREKDEDYRALSEAGRVQFYWNLTGIGNSVSSNYMQRQRTELDWVRGAIRSICLPYHWWRDQFQCLSPRQKLAIFRATKRRWIDNQLGYFQSNYRRKHHLLHSAHKLGFVLAMAGLLQFAFWILCWWDARNTSWGNTVPMVTVAAAVGLAVAILVIAMLRKAGIIDAQHSHLGWRSLWHELRPAGDKDTAARPLMARVQEAHWFVMGFVWQFILKLTDSLVPTFEPVPTSPRRTHILAGRKLWSFLVHLLLAFVLGGFVFIGASWAASSTHTPSAEHLGIITGGTLLLCGAMVVAWAEKTMQSELGYQYHVMAGLYKHAALRMDELMESMASCIDAPGDDGAATFEAVVAETQEFLFELGKEALDENAEWLLLHRARPLEPVLAG